MKKRFKKSFIGLLTVGTLVLATSFSSSAAVVQRNDGKFWGKMNLTRHTSTISNGSYHSHGVSYIGSWIKRSHRISWAVTNKKYNMYIDGIYYLGLQDQITKMDVATTFRDYY